MVIASAPLHINLLPWQTLQSGLGLPGHCSTMFTEGFGPTGPGAASWVRL